MAMMTGDGNYDSYLIAKAHDGEGDGEAKAAGQQHHSPAVVIMRYAVVVIILKIRQSCK